MDPFIKAAFGQAHLFEQIINNVPCFVKFMSINNECYDIVCKYQIDAELLVKQDKIKFPVEVGKRMNCLPPLRSANHKWNECTTDVLLSFEVNPSDLIFNLNKLKIEQLQNELNKYPFLSTLSIDQLFTKAKRTSNRPMNICHVIENLKSSKIKAIKYLDTQLLIDYFYDNQRDPKILFRGFDNLEYVSIRLALLDPSEVDTYKIPELYKRIASAFENKPNLVVSFYISDCKYSKKDILFSHQLVNLLEKFEKRGIKLSYLFQGTNSLLEYHTYSYVPLQSLYLKDIFFDNSFALFTKSMLMEKFSFVKNSDYGRLEEICIADNAAIFTCAGLNQLLGCLSNCSNLKKVRLRILDSGLSIINRSADDFSRFLERIILDLPKSVMLLEFGCLPMFNARQFNFKLNEHFSHLRELKIYFDFKVFCETQFKDDFFMAFTNLEILHVNCIKKSNLKFNETLKVVNIFKWCSRNLITNKQNCNCHCLSYDFPSNFKMKTNQSRAINYDVFCKRAVYIQLFLDSQFEEDKHLTSSH
uniref:DUF38 domain-containing protein n=1 Tax=Rhabditophanes sp. KR3021 TaxID=114890 RepID=A0AC35TUN6_9BILA